MNKSKKGIIEVGFSWIFILIAGTVILGLFVYVGFSQGDSFKTMMNVGMLEDLNSIFISAQISKGTSVPFDIPKTNLKFDCNTYSIEGISHSLAGQFVFAPEKLSTDNLIAWSESWSLGFRITNFLFLTSPYIKYYIVYDANDYALASFAEKMYDNMPNTISKELLPYGTGEIKDENYEKIVVLFLNKDQSFIPEIDMYNPSDFKGYKKEDITFIYANHIDIKTIENSLITQLNFKNKDFESIDYGTPLTIYDESALYGAFISGSYKLSNCVLGRAFLKASDVIKVYRYRSEKLDSSICNYNYELARLELDSMINNLGSKNGVVNVDDLKYNIIQIAGINDILETFSCSLLY